MQLYDSVHSYGNVQAHLGMSKVITNIKSAVKTELCQDWMNLWYWFFFYLFNCFKLFNSQILEFWSQISLSQVDSMILSLNVSPEWLHLLSSFSAQQFSVVIETYWINFSYWLMGYGILCWCLFEVKLVMTRFSLVYP